MQRRIAVLGLDGASFDILEAMAASGVMPNVARVLADGGSAILESTVPIWTIPSWATCWTGVSPAVHGLLYSRTVGPWLPWRSDREDPFCFLPFGRLPMLWDLLGPAGARVGCLDIPLGFPAREVNGFFTGGFMCPPDSELLAWPRDLLAGEPGWLPEVTRSTLAEVLRTDRRGRRAYLDAIAEQVRLRRRFLATHLDGIDVLVHVNVVPDRTCHLDFGAVRRLAASGSGEEGLAACWRATDDLVGDVLAWLGDEGVLLVVSDHGFASGPRCNVARWLEVAGLEAPVGARVLSAKRALGRVVPAGAREWLVKGVRRARGIPAHLSITSGRTVAPLWVDSVDSRAAYFFVDPSAGDREALVGRIVEAARTHAGLPAGPRPFGDVRDGAELLGAVEGRIVPDVIILPSEDWILVHDPGEPRLLLDANDDFANHHRDGVIMAFGPSVERGRFARAAMVDVLPTVLAAAGVALDGDVEGKVLPWLARAGAGMPVVVAGPAGISGSATGAVSDGGASSLTEAEEKALEAHLQSLGYID